MFGGCDVVAVDYMCDDAVSLVFEVNHSPHFSGGSRDGEDGFPCGCVHVEGGGRGERRRRRKEEEGEDEEGRGGGGGRKKQKEEEEGRRKGERRREEEDVKER